MNYSVSYMQYRERESLKYRLTRYLPFGLLISCLVVISATAMQLEVDLSRLLFKEINHVRIEGEYRHIDRFEIEQLLSPFLGNSVDRDEMDVIAKILKDLPWVKDVLIKRNWRDDTLVLRIEERQAVAYWGGKALLDRDGEIFIPRLIDNADLPILDAEAGREKHLLHFL